MKTFRRRKRRFTLIEMLIALGLGTILLSSLLGIYQLLEYQAIQQRQTRTALFAERLLQYRLTSAFTSTLRDTDTKNFVFYTSEGTSSIALGQSLVFVTDRGPDHLPEFSNEVLTRLYRDSDGNLCFAYWPLPSRWEGDDPPPMHKEVLIGGVIDLAFEFFVPPDPQGKVVGVDDPVKEGREQVVPAVDQWHAAWDLRYKTLPAMVRVAITRENQDGTVKRETYGYVIPASQSHIVYGG